MCGVVEFYYVVLSGGCCIVLCALCCVVCYGASCVVCGVVLCLTRSVVHCVLHVVLCFDVLSIVVYCVRLMEYRMCCCVEICVAFYVILCVVLGSLVFPECCGVCVVLCPREGVCHLSL